MGGFVVGEAKDGDADGFVAGWFGQVAEGEL